jgi:hypothetical protein
MPSLVEYLNNSFDHKFKKTNSINANYNNINFNNNTIYYNSNSNSNLICKDTSYILGRNEGYTTIHYNNIPYDFMVKHCS